jgi:hypothetical protein
VSKKKSERKKAAKRKSSETENSVICINKDCKLRKQKSCKGFEACPGFKGR